MSGWELFTWVNVWILAAGSIGVFVLFLLQLKSMLRRISHKENGREKEPDTASRSGPGENP